MQEILVGAASEPRLNVWEDTHKMAFGHSVTFSAAWDGLPQIPTILRFKWLIPYVSNVSAVIKD